MTRKISHQQHREEILRKFEENGGVLLRRDLMAISHNHTARISELRDLGHRIVCKMIKDPDDPDYTRGGKNSRYFYEGYEGKPTTRSYLSKLHPFARAFHKDNELVSLLNSVLDFSKDCDELRSAVCMLSTRLDTHLASKATP